MARADAARHPGDGRDGRPLPMRRRRGAGGCELAAFEGAGPVPGGGPRRSWIG